MCIWQSLKKDLNAHGFVNIIRRKLIFGSYVVFSFAQHEKYTVGGMLSLTFTAVIFHSTSC